MSIIDTYNYYYYEKADDRVSEWFLARSLWPISLILLSYVVLVFKIGPHYMKDKPAYSLRTFMKFYNIFQIAANAYIVYEILSVYPDAKALTCEPGDYSKTPDAMQLARACYHVTLLKLVDLLETGIFVLRKKNNQITFLHVYHHISTLLFALMFLRYMATGMTMFYHAANCSVHVIMYTYYLISSIEGPIRKKVLPFKNYITLIQMVQFFFMILHASISLLPSCPVSPLPGLVIIPNVVLNFTLFYNFYKKAYLYSNKKRE